MKQLRTLFVAGLALVIAAMASVPTPAPHPAPLSFQGLQSFSVAPASTTPTARAAAAVEAVFSAASGTAHAASMTDYLENKLADHLFRTTTYTQPAALAVGLLTAGCSDSAAGTEVTGGSYTRVSNNPANANWKGTHASTTGASSGTGGTISNAVTLTFPAPTANWGSITHFGIYDAASGGNLLFCAALTTPKTVNNGDAAPSFAVDALTVQMDN